MTLVVQFDDPNILEEFQHTVEMGGATTRLSKEQLTVEHANPNFIQAFQQVAIFLGQTAIIDEQGKVN